MVGQSRRDPKSNQQCHKRTPKGQLATQSQKTNKNKKKNNKNQHFFGRVWLSSFWLRCVASSCFLRLFVAAVFFGGGCASRLQALAKPSAGTVKTQKLAPYAQKLMRIFRGSVAPVGQTCLSPIHRKIRGRTVPAVLTNGRRARQPLASTCPTIGRNGKNAKTRSECIKKDTHFSWKYCTCRPKWT